MTNNTIPNVPRELLERCCKRMYDMMQGDLHEELRALLSAPSPAGVDGLEVVAWADSGGALYTAKLLEIMAVDSVGCEPLCRLPDATAIIDGLRGEVAELESTLADNLELSGKRAVRIAEIGHELADAISERDQQAQRIGELDGLLEHASKYIAPGAVLTLIKSTLSAGKDSEQ